MAEEGESLDARIARIEQSLERQAREAQQRNEQTERQNRLMALLLERMDQQVQPDPPLAAENQPQEPLPALPVARAEELNYRIPDVAPVIGEPVYERFRKQKPPVFEGGPDPVTAENWIKKIQQIVSYMQLSDAERVACAIYQMTFEARSWWEVTVMS